jgi:hypothetical protein
MDYELYHDESQIDGYWHGMLLVPITAKQRIVDLLDKARSVMKYSAPLSFKNVRRPNRVFGCATAWLTIAVASLRSKATGDPVPICLGQKKPGEWLYELFPDHLGAKFILFCERDTLATMTGHPDHASKVETTLRMGLKGGLHFLGNEDDPIALQRIHFDGHEHYHRHVDRSRLVDRLTGLRDYCNIATRADLIDDSSSDHRRKDSQPYEDCQLLQLTDLMVGAFRVALRGSSNELHARLAYPAVSLIQRYAEGPARMANSRWHNSFTMSQCYLEGGAWHFQPLECVPNARTQLPLPLT